MRLGELIAKLERLRDGGSAGAEGYDDDGELIQRFVETVETEARCEEDDELRAVYLTLADEAFEEAPPLRCKNNP